MSADDRVHVGFLGLGNMGWPMARNLSRAGHRLTVRDVDAGRQRRFAAEHDCLEAGTPAAFARTPVGVARAADGTLSIMIGGDDDDAIARAEPVLRALGGRLFRTGPLGSGHAMKALNNYVGAAAYLTAAEALAVGQHYGLDVDVMLDVMNSSTGRSFNTEHVLKEDVVTGRYGTGFALGLMA